MLYPFVHSTKYNSLGYISLGNDKDGHIEKLNATMGESITIYHESSKNVSFCAVNPPFSPGILRAQFQSNHANAHVNITQVSR